VIACAQHKGRKEMLAFSALLLVGHALYLYVTTGWHWSRSDLDNSSGYRIVEAMTIIESLAGSMALVCALWPTPKRVRYARFALAPVFIILTIIYVFASSSAAASNESVRPLLIALSDDPDAEKQIHETGWYLRNALLPMVIFFLASMAVLVSGSIYSPRKRPAGSELPTTKNPHVSRWFIVMVSLIAGATFAMHATNLSRFYPSETFARELKSWSTEGSSLYSSMAGVSSLCYQYSDDDYPMRLDRHDTSLILYDTNITLIEWQLPAGALQSYTRAPLFASYHNITIYNALIDIDQGPFIDCRLHRDGDNRNSFIFNMQRSISLATYIIDGDGQVTQPSILSAIVYILDEDRDLSVSSILTTYTLLDDESSSLEFSNLTITFRLLGSQSLIARHNALAAEPSNYVTKNAAASGGLSFLSAVCFLPALLISIWWLGLRGRFTEKEAARIHHAWYIKWLATLAGASPDDLAKQVDDIASTGKAQTSGHIAVPSSPSSSSPPSPVTPLSSVSMELSKMNSSSNLLEGSNAPLSPLDMTDATGFQALPNEPTTPSQSSPTSTPPSSVAPPLASSTTATTRASMIGVAPVNDSMGAMFVEVKVNDDNAIVVPSPDISNLQQSLTSNEVH
jgi:hypothetical protein